MECVVDIVDENLNLNKPISKALPLLGNKPNQTPK